MKTTEKNKNSESNKIQQNNKNEIKSDKNKIKNVIMLLGIKSHPK